MTDHNKNQGQLLKMYIKASGIPAKEAALKSGLKLVENGGAWWGDCIMADCGGKEMMYFTQGGKYKCAACDRGGDSADFYANLYGIDRSEAVERLVNDFPGQVTEEPAKAASKQPKEPKEFIIPGSYEWERREINRKIEQQRDEARAAAKRMKEEGIATREQIRGMLAVAESAEARLEINEHFRQARLQNDRNIENLMNWKKEGNE